MALADTGRAIGKATELLKSNLETLINDRYYLDIDVLVGRPESLKNVSTGKNRLNLFLYESLFDPSLKNSVLDEGQPPPIWLVLKYLLTAFDKEGDSDSSQAHECLGQGIQILQEMNFLTLSDNPEPLKITFDETSYELLSKIMQGSDEKYRFSIGFQVRPVMIAAVEPPSYSLLVGVDYTESPLEIIGEKGIKIPVIPSMGPSITSISPLKFEENYTITIFGSDLNLSGLAVHLGSAELAVTSQRVDQLQCKVNGAIAGGGIISAGSHPLSVVQKLTTERCRSSNLLVGDLLPTLSSVSTDALAPTNPDIVWNIIMKGSLLGSEVDDIFVALYKEGRVIKLFDGPDRLAKTDTQSTLTLNIKKEDAILPGKYRVILKINGQQAKNSPEVELVV